jgi:tRNA pseudouridine38-40 synthase
VSAVRNIKLTIEYDGTDLSGWQRQDNAPTVQEHLETRLREITGEQTSLIGASRTDAGVHALGQVANFQTETTIPVRGIRLALNGVLPDAIAVVDAVEVDADFHARFSASGKHYRYAILNRTDPSPLRGRTSWQRPRPLNLAAMREAALHMVGERDFSAFRATGCGAKNATRHVTDVSLSERGDDLLWVEVRGNAFLRNMVRIMVGTLVDVGVARFTPGQVLEILESRDRTRAGQTAPARGLTLVEVFHHRDRMSGRAIV